MLEKELQQDGVTNVKEVLAPKRRLRWLLVTGIIPPGGQKGRPDRHSGHTPGRKPDDQPEGGYLERCFPA